jgi:hypothetical protein
VKEITDGSPCRSPDDADGFRRIRHGERRNHVHALGGEHLHLRQVRRFRLFGVGRAVGHVSVSRRADNAVDDDRVDTHRPSGADIVGEPHRVFREPQNIVVGEADLGGPLDAAAPCVGIEHEPRTGIFGQGEEPVEIVAHFLAGAVVVHQDESGELWSFKAFNKEHPGFEPAVGQERFVGFHQFLHAGHFFLLQAVRCRRGVYVAVARSESRPVARFERHKIGF